MAARTGAQYLAGLRDERAIWFGGERVADVTTHPILGRMAHTLAALYDLQWNPAYQDQLTYASPSTGEPVSLAFLQPRTVEDLARKRGMYKCWADQSGGMLGRTPDYLNAILAGCAMARDHFAKNGPEYAERVTAYYEWAREHDPCATHTFLDPQVNRAKSQTEQADPTVPLHIVEETSDGLIVSGGRMLATLAPFSDEIQVFPSPTRLQPQDAARYAFAFAIPMATRGLKLICREGFDAGRPTEDHPLASRFEEMDCVAVFDRVLVPWERVFLKGDIALCNGLFRQTHAFTGHAIHQFETKNLAKSEFVFGVASLIAESLGRTELQPYQMMLGEMVDVIETIRAYLRGAEADSIVDDAGWRVPNPNIMSTARNYYPKAYPRLIEIVQLIGSSGLMATPTLEDRQHPELAADIDKYYQSATLGGLDRVRLFRLAWDLAVSSFGSRQLLYERFFAGDPYVLMSTRFLSYDRRPMTERVKALVAHPEAPILAAATDHAAATTNGSAGTETTSGAAASAAQSSVAAPR